MHTPTNGAPAMNAPQTVDVTTRHLPGDVTATVVTVRDLESIETAAQLTVPDEPLTAPELLDLADALRTLARDLTPGRAA